LVRDHPREFRARRSRCARESCYCVRALTQGPGRAATVIILVIKGGQDSVPSDPTATNRRQKNRPEIASFRPVVVCPVGLQNLHLDLIRFGGHLSKGEYDVQTDGRHTEAASAPPVY
jgi:hypothetical protein